ncbi:SIMPL domain-containing protein [Pseudonocardia acidicola]|uniref:SIMPL domain-containing protein n=1 Tax=Pseudonocardia acidicola TaxID=2724939 RepID=A0ABX1SDG7_9PSEU|nr:SIMPL domain-containing protein [Pseudonocardia acidicola]
MTATAPGAADRPEIITEGTGWFEQRADQAEIDVSFSATGKTRAAAVRELGRRVAAAEPVLSRPGLTVRHRRLWVHTDWRGSRTAGCRADEEIALLITEVESLEDVLGRLISTEPAAVNGPRWTLRDPSAALREAQQRAVADARDRAEGYAAALGGLLGPLRRLSEAPDHASPVAFRMAARAEAAVDVQELGLEPEPVRITARCTTSWSLLS